MEITLFNGGSENSIQRLQVYVNYLKPKMLFFVIYPDVAQEVPDFLLSSVPLKSAKIFSRAEENRNTDFQAPSYNLKSIAWFLRRHLF